MHHLSRPAVKTATSITHEKISPYHLQERAVGDILEDYDQHDDHFAELEELLRAHYNGIGMTQAFPERADMLISRKVRNVGQVVMKALCDEILMKNITPHLATPDALVKPYASVGTLYVEGAGQQQTGKYEEFMQAMTAWYMGATMGFFHQQIEEGEYKDLWELLAQQEQEYKEKWKEYRRAAEKRSITNLNPPFMPFGDLNKSIFRGIGNNVLTIQSELLAHQRDRDNQPAHEEEESYAAYLRRTALARTAFLLLPASTNRHITAQILPDPEAISLANEDVSICEDPLKQTSAPHAIITDEGGSSRWDHRSLWAGNPWPVPGNCVGDIAHVPTPGNESVVDNFFDEVSQFTGMKKLSETKMVNSNRSALRIVLVRLSPNIHYM